jgi:hypothetical protein
MFRGGTAYFGFVAMTERVWRDGGDIRKQIAATPEGKTAAGSLILSTQSLRAAGVATPDVRHDAQNQTLVFQFVEGTAGLAMIEACGDHSLADLLRPLLALHRTVLDGLRPFDPAAKIRPRLAPGDPAAFQDDLQALLAEIPEQSVCTPVHGDFHAGQLVVDATGVAWLLDLEDLAAGPVESDLGNFAAHIATRPETWRGPVLQGFEHWLGRTLEAYRSVGGVAQRAVTRNYGRIALIRRALKLRERGDPSVLIELAER